MNSFAQFLQDALGVGREAARLTALQTGLRAFVVFLVAVILLRLGSKRFMGKSTPLDVLLGFVLGSVLSRAINGSAAFVPTIVAALVLVALHWLFTAIAMRSPRFGWLVKGRPRTIVLDGKVQDEEMARAHVARDDLEEALRHHDVADIAQVREANLERNGDISILTKTTGHAAQRSHVRVR